ncbi:MAG: SPASM domain-containing protein, partial [Candidatus Thiodiazotropha sp.]
HTTVGGNPVEKLFFEFAPLENQCRSGRCGDGDDDPAHTPAADADWQVRYADALIDLAASTPWPAEHFLIPQLRPAAALSDDWGDLRLCDYLRGDGVFVAPSGEMFSCMNRAHQAVYALGNAAQDPYLFRNDRYLKIINFDPFHDPECRACHFLPMCLMRCPMRDDGELVNAHSGCRAKRHAEVMRLARRMTESVH